MRPGALFTRPELKVERLTYPVMPQQHTITRITHDAGSR
ncbi:CRISPR-associated protein Cas5 [Saccharopolyspora soli]